MRSRGRRAPPPDRGPCHASAPGPRPAPASRRSGRTRARGARSSLRDRGRSCGSLPAPRAAVPHVSPCPARRRAFRRLAGIPEGYSWLTAGVALALGFALVHLPMLGHIPLSGDEAYYWESSRHPDWSYSDMPPLVIVLLGLSTRLFGVN